MRLRRITNRTTEQTRQRAVPLRIQQEHSWYRIENHRKVSSATVYLYDEIGLWGITASDFVREINAIDAKHIDVHINSPGGDVFDAIAIYNALANHGASITTYVDGIAASAASFIAQAGSPVKIARNASMMIHDAEGICMGNCTAMLEMYDLLNAASNNIADIYTRSGGTVSQWRERMKAETWYHNGQDAVDAGLADEVYDPNGGVDEGSADDNASDDNVAASTSAVHIVNASISTEDIPIARVGVGMGTNVGGDGTADETNFVISAEMVAGAFTNAIKELDIAPFDPDHFRLVMSSVADNIPAIAVDAPPPPVLPPMPPPDTTVKCQCGRPIDAEHIMEGEHTIDPATLRHIMADALSNAPGLPDVDVVPRPIGDSVTVIDSAEVISALRKGLL